MQGIYLTTLFLLGLFSGSFLSVVVDRMPKGEGVVGGRSRCPECKNQIRWFDNIPLLSYIILGAKCRDCGKQIPRFYPFIEGFMGFLFVLIFLAVGRCDAGTSVFCQWSGELGQFTLPFFLLVATFLVGIFITDLRHQLIPDELSLGLFVIASLGLIFARPDKVYVNFFTGFVAAGFLLMLHLITKGKGMGLGDVKLAIPLGIILGFPLTVWWMSMGFIIGAVVGVVLILSKKTEFGRHIAFGPFLIIAFAITLFCSNQIIERCFPVF
ncbi:prepilin peptidase [Patescibacteria group bacterium]